MVELQGSGMLGVATINTPSTHLEFIDFLSPFAVGTGSIDSSSFSTTV